jgi:hypothetical protein
MKFSNIFLILLFLFITGCKNSKKSTDNDKKIQIPEKIPEKNPKKNLNLKPNSKIDIHKLLKKNFNYKCTEKSSFFISLNFQKLREIPLIKKNIVSLKEKASKNGILGSLISCGCDFSKNLTNFVFQFSKDYKKIKDGGFYLEGDFDTKKLIDCLPKEMEKQGWKKTSSNPLKIIKGDIEVEIKIKNKNTIIGKTQNWNFINRDKIFDKELISKQIKTDQLAYLGATCPDLTIPIPVKSVLIGVDSFENQLNITGGLLFPGEKSSILVEKLFKSKINSYLKLKGGVNNLAKNILRKTEIKNVSKIVLLNLKLTILEIFEIIKTIQLNLRQKQ